jgi:hypothetical protein
LTQRKVDEAMSSPNHAAKANLGEPGERAEVLKGTSTSPQVDLTRIPAVAWAWVAEHVYAAIRGCSVKVLQNERRLNIGCPFRRINGTMIRYRFGDIMAFLESQPGGGGTAEPCDQRRRGAGRPRKSTT